ncbi:hypothetical protein HWD94_03925 [Pseudarthrobacter equi]|uniref:hypothetical protein n=1 Tax=Pseudarthrobacter equi TaxID=728066 RepID=UPI0021C076B4|nr:hypothetical protein [Pseudarthrobacter equi]MCT9624271.1 hypothetical protein [Pseudarthrobacter equi]
MTEVHIKVRRVINGAEVPAEGALRWEASARRRGADDALVLPQGFHVPLVEGEALVDVEPSSTFWAWSVTEMFVGQPSRRRLLAVPAEDAVAYTDLLDLDPATLDVASLNVTPDPDHPGLYLIGA